jgi:hypothetical protein
MVPFWALVFTAAATALVATIGHVDPDGAARLVVVASFGRRCGHCLGDRRTHHRQARCRRWRLPIAAKDARRMRRRVDE